MDDTVAERFAALLTLALRGRTVAHSDESGDAYQIESVHPSGHVLLADGRCRLAGPYETASVPAQPFRFHGALVDPKDVK